MTVALHEETDSGRLTRTVGSEVAEDVRTLDLKLQVVAPRLGPYDLVSSSVLSAGSLADRMARAGVAETTAGAQTGHYFIIVFVGERKMQPHRCGWRLLPSRAPSSGCECHANEC